MHWFAPTRRRLLILCISSVLICFLSGAYLVHGQVSALSAPPTHIADTATRRPLPASISFPTTTQPTPVPLQATRIEQGEWYVSSDVGNILEQGARPDESGNIIVYGHNTKDIFWRLHELRVGDEVILRTTDERQHRYKITERVTILADDVSYIAPTESEVLTIYTFTGWFERERLVIRALPVEEI